MMQAALRRWGAAAAVVCMSVGAAHGQSLVPVSVGPDVLVGDLPGTSNYGTSTLDNGFAATAIGTTSCNKGDLGFNWFTGGTDNRHPAIGQNLFRLHNGRFEQIGQAWLKHGFTALQGSLCSNTQGFSQHACSNNPTGGSKLGVGCSDPYGSGLNGSQGGLGPKWQVNASTGLFPYPWAQPTGACCTTANVCSITTSSGCASPSTFKGPGSVCSPTPCGISGGAVTGQRLRFRLSDVNSATFPGAQYFVEGQYVAGDDAASGYDNNNASYRTCTVDNAGNVTSTGATNRELPAIYGWRAADPSVQISTIDLAGDGMFILGCKVSGPASGVYTYEYALHNLNSDRCAGSFVVPTPAGGSPGALGFHDVEYHSGERNAVDQNNPSSDDWASAISGSAISWTGPAYAGTPAVYTMDGSIPFKVNSFAAGTGNDHTANVLRWGTLFNFRFTTTHAPAPGRVQIGLWRPGTPSSVTINTQTPGGAVIGTEPVGTCCNGATCTIVTASACGTHNPGACCIGATCTSTVPAACYGNFLGAGTVCSPSPCPSTTNIRFKLAGGSCSPNPCSEPARGACCRASDGICHYSTQANCGVEYTASYLGDGSVCSPNPCPSAGACCNGTSCTTVLQTGCSGSFLGSGTSCSPNPCSGSCCIGTACTVTTPAGCSGFYTGGGSCSPNPCTGACCVGTTCSIAQASSCSGTYLGGGTTCSPNNCGGACCTAGAVCNLTTSAGCTGAYLGNGTVCSATSCVNNDLCADAIALCDGVGVSGSTASATLDGTASCASSASTRDVWYSYTPSVSASVTVDLCTASYDTALAVFTGNCGSLVQIGCDDDACGSLRSRIAGIAMTAGTRYTIRVSGYNGAFGTFTVTCTGGAGGNCNAPSGTCCTAGTCTFVQQANCATGTWTSGGSCTPSPCTGACCVAGGCSTTTLAACNGTWTGGGSCTPNPCPPLTDDCANRQGIGLGPTPFDTTNATTDGPAHALCLNSSDNNVGKDIWFNFPSTFDGTLVVETCGSSFDTKLAVYSGSVCTDFESRLLACNDDTTCSGGGTLSSRVTINVTCGQSYTIRVGGFTSGGVPASGTGTLTLIGTPAATGSCCIGTSCTSTYATCCAGTFTVGASCVPNPCDSGACCCGSSCRIVSQAACSGVGQAYVGSGTSCIPYSATVPCCRGDYNRSGGTSVQDIFDFLSGYFAQDPCSDSNDSNTNSVQDIFDFLTAYFGGC